MGELTRVALLISTGFVGGIIAGQVIMPDEDGKIPKSVVTSGIERQVEDELEEDFNARIETITELPSRKVREMAEDTEVPTISEGSLLEQVVEANGGGILETQSDARNLYSALRFISSRASDSSVEAQPDTLGDLADQLKNIITAHAELRGANELMDGMKVKAKNEGADVSMDDVAEENLIIPDQSLQDRLQDTADLLKKVTKLTIDSKQLDNFGPNIVPKYYWKEASKVQSNAKQLKHLPQYDKSERVRQLISVINEYSRLLEVPAKFR
mgnify:CR=1 FL=1